MISRRCKLRLNHANLRVFFFSYLFVIFSSCVLEFIDLTACWDHRWETQFPTSGIKVTAMDPCSRAQDGGGDIESAVISRGIKGVGRWLLEYIDQGGAFKDSMMIGLRAIQGRVTTSAVSRRETQSPTTEMKAISSLFHPFCGWSYLWKGPPQ